MSVTSENYTLDDFIQEDSTCASCGVDENPSWTIPAGSPVGQCIGLDSDGEVCDECFNNMNGVYRAGGTQ